MPTAARLAAARALQGVFEQGRRVPDTWDAHLEREEAVLAQALLGLCLRRWGRLEHHARMQLKQPERPVPFQTTLALAMGLAQLAWLPGVADHAAVNESVELMGDRELGFLPHRGLVNAVLRRAARDREALAAALDALDATLDQPPFVRRVLAGALAPRGSQTSAPELWARLQRPPRPAFRSLRAAPLPPGLQADPALPQGLRLEPGSPFPLDWLRSGAGLVQDRSSQLLMSFRWEGRPGRILDACAAPGGKTAALAARWPGVPLTALERDPRRAERLSHNLDTWGVRAQVAVEDAERTLERDREGFDLILLDAPCSGSGTLQKHPELAWLGDALDIQALLRRQRALLGAALPRLRPGGLLIYAVCSWLPEECEQHLDGVIQGNPGIQAVFPWDAAFSAEAEAPRIFRPDPLAWEGEGFQAFALTRPPGAAAR